MPNHVDTENFDGTLGRQQQTKQHCNRGSFTGTVTAEQRRRRAAANFKAHVIDRDDAVETLADVAYRDGEFGHGAQRNSVPTGCQATPAVEIRRDEAIVAIRGVATTYCESTP